MILLSRFWLWSLFCSAGSPGLWCCAHTHNADSHPPTHTVMHAGYTYTCRERQRGKNRHECYVCTIHFYIWKCVCMLSSRYGPQSLHTHYYTARFFLPTLNGSSKTLLFTHTLTYTHNSKGRKVKCVSWQQWFNLETYKYINIFNVASHTSIPLLMEFRNTYGVFVWERERGGEGDRET